MTNSTLFVVAILVIEVLFLSLAGWTRAQPPDLPARGMNKEAAKILANGAVRRWVALLESIETKLPQGVIDEKASELHRYIEDNARFL